MNPTSQSINPYQGLYIVATPIGNLADITLRAISVLQNCDLILCEDTRVSRKLLEKHGITTPLKPYHDHNGEKLRPRIMEDLTSGQAIALISDAGTPLVSDPGFKLVSEAREKGVTVTPIPGASAFLTGLSASGLPTNKFIFLGFLPVKKAQVKTLLAEYLPLSATQIYYETAKRIEKTLALLKELAPEREIVVARELTKAYEEFLRGTAEEVMGLIENKGAPLKGEIVLLIAPSGEAPQIDDEALTAILKKTLESESVSSAAKIVAKTYNVPRKRVYEIALKLSEK